MIDATLVDALGMIAGAVWVSGAIYFQMIRVGNVHPAWTILMFSVGAALMLGSSAIAVVADPATVALLGAIANVIFIVLGIGLWIALEKYAAIRETMDESPLAESLH